MSEPTLTFERLNIRRMPGFDLRGFTLEELSPRVNVVYGPNASGKTTTATALNALLWPEGNVPPKTSVTLTVGVCAWAGLAALFAA